MQGETGNVTAQGSGVRVVRAMTPGVTLSVRADQFLARMRPAKRFASAYAIFSGLVFLSLMGMFLVPVAHRMLHRFHMDDTDTPESNPSQK